MQPLDPLIEAFIILSTFDRIDTSLHASASIYSRHLLAAWPHRYAGYCSRLEFGVGAHSYVPSTLLTYLPSTLPLSHHAQLPVHLRAFWRVCRVDCFGALSRLAGMFHTVLCVVRASASMVVWNHDDTYLPTCTYMYE